MQSNLVVSEVLASSDKVCRKYIQRTKDNYRIETTYVDYKNKYIICFSTQIGCNLGCKFCYNGIMHNFKRNLTFEELCEEIENVIEKEGFQSSKPYLFSAMGIGEPLLNYDNLIKLFHYLNNKYPGNKFALATTGVSLNNILRLADDLKDIEKFKLTISLHSTDNKVRESLMPIKQNIDELVKTVKKYKEISGREVEWNYVLFDKINDSLEAARELLNLLGKDEYIKINKFNKVSISEIKESKNIKIFMDELKRLGMNAEFYETNGSDINAACGQMVAE